MLKDRLKESNILSANEHVKETNEFFRRLLPLDSGNVVTVLFEDTDCGFLYSYPQSKICPKLETTPTLADNLFSFNGPTTYFHIGEHRYPKDHTFSEKTLIFSNAIMVDVDNFPLEGFLNREDKVKAIFESYPILNDIPPCIIVDTGKKGFQAYWIFAYNMISNKCFHELKSVLTILLEGDMSLIRKLQIGRVPYTRRYNGNTPTIIFNSENNYDFFAFCSVVRKMIKDYVITYDAEIRRKNDESLFCADIQASLTDYLKTVVGIKELFADERQSQQRPLRVNWKEQTDEAMEYYKEKKGESKQEEQKQTVKNLSKPTRKKLSYPVMVKKDLFVLLAATKGELTGYRNNFLFILGVNEKCLYSSPEEIDRIVHETNARFTQPLCANEVEGILKSVKAHNYHVSRKWIGARLPMHLSANKKLAYSSQEIAHEKQKKCIEESKRRRIRERERLKKQNRLYGKFILNAAEISSVTELAKTMGWSRPTVYKYLKKFSGIIKARKRAKDKTPEHQEYVLPRSSPRAIALPEISQLSFLARPSP